jgi:hypothetical protein
MQNRTTVAKRNVVLKIETYERLEKYKIKLINEKGTAQLSYDEVINSLLDEVGVDRKT